MLIKKERKLSIFGVTCNNIIFKLPRENRIKKIQFADVNFMFDD